MIMINYTQLLMINYIQLLYLNILFELFGFRNMSVEKIRSNIFKVRFPYHRDERLIVLTLMICNGETWVREIHTPSL